MGFLQNGTWSVTKFDTPFLSAAEQFNQRSPVILWISCPLLARTGFCSGKSCLCWLPWSSTSMRWTPTSMTSSPLPSLVLRLLCPVSLPAGSPTSTHPLTRAPLPSQALLLLHPADVPAKDSPPARQDRADRATAPPASPRRGSTSRAWKSPWRLPAASALRASEPRSQLSVAVCQVLPRFFSCPIPWVGALLGVLLEPRLAGPHRRHSHLALG